MKYIKTFEVLNEGQIYRTGDTVSGKSGGRSITGTVIDQRGDIIYVEVNGKVREIKARDIVESVNEGRMDQKVIKALKKLKMDKNDVPVEAYIKLANDSKSGNEYYHKLLDYQDNYEELEGHQFPTDDFVNLIFSSGPNLGESINEGNPWAMEKAFKKKGVEINVQDLERNGGFFTTYDNITKDELLDIANSVDSKWKYEVSDPIKSQETGYYLLVNFTNESINEGKYWAIIKTTNDGTEWYTGSHWSFSRLDAKKYKDIRTPSKVAKKVGGMVHVMDESVNEAEEVEVTQEMWDKDWKIRKAFGKEYEEHFAKRIEAAMSKAKNEDMAENWALINWKQLPGKADGMTIKESVNEFGPLAGSGNTDELEKWKRKASNKSSKGQMVYVVGTRSGSYKLSKYEDEGNTYAAYYNGMQHDIEESLSETKIIKKKLIKKYSIPSFALDYDGGATAPEAGVFLDMKGLEPGDVVDNPHGDGKVIVTHKTKDETIATRAHNIPLHEESVKNMKYIKTYESVNEASDSKIKGVFAEFLKVINKNPKYKSVKPTFKAAKRIALEFDPDVAGSWILEDIQPYLKKALKGYRVEKLEWAKNYPSQLSFNVIAKDGTIYSFDQDLDDKGFDISYSSLNESVNENTLADKIDKLDKTLIHTSNLDAADEWDPIAVEYLNNDKLLWYQLDDKDLKIAISKAEQIIKRYKVIIETIELDAGPSSVYVGDMIVADKPYRHRGRTGLYWDGKIKKGDRFKILDMSRGQWELEAYSVTQDPGSPTIIASIPEREAIKLFTKIS